MTKKEDSLSACTANPSTFVDSRHEAQVLVRTIAGSREAQGGAVKAALRDVQTATRIPWRRVRAFWYGEAKRIDATEMDRLREIARRLDAYRAKTDAILREIGE